MFTPTRPTRPSHQSNTKLRYGGIAAAVVGLTLLCAVSLSANDGVGSDLTLSNSALDQLNTLTLGQEGASNGAALGLNLDQERSTWHHAWWRAQRAHLAKIKAARAARHARFMAAHAARMAAFHKSLGWSLDQEGASNGAALGLNLDKERSTWARQAQGRAPAFHKSLGW